MPLRETFRLPPINDLKVALLLERLEDDVTRQLAVLKLEGYTNQEAAQQLKCSLTTVERRLRLIRKTWSQ